MVLLTAKQAAAHIHVSTATFWRMRKDFPLPGIKVYRRELFDVEELEKWFLSKERTSSLQG